MAIEIPVSPEKYDAVRRDRDAWKKMPGVRMLDPIEWKRAGFPPVCCGIFMRPMPADDAVACSKCGRKITALEVVSGSEPLRSRCECGVAKTGGNHSSWCPMAARGGRI